MTALTLIIGSEAVLVDRAVLAAAREARSADPTLAKIVINAAGEDAAHQLTEAAAPNLFGEGAIVVLEGIDGADDPLAAAVLRVVDDPSPDVTLIITHPGGMKGKALLDKLKAAGATQIECKPVKKGKDTVEFLTREFASHKRKATSAAVSALYESIGHDLGLLAGAVSQLVSDVEANPIDIGDVRGYFAGVADVSTFALSDAVWERRYVDAMLLLRQSMLVDPARVGPATTSALASGLRSLVRAGGMPHGVSRDTVAKEIGVPPWKVDQLRKQWSRWSGDQRRLASAVVALADADAAVKGGVLEGSSLDAEQKLLAMEILVAMMSATSH